MISRRLVIGLLGVGAAFALYASSVALALSPEARNAKLDEALRVLVEGRSTPGIVVLILQNGRPVYSRSVGVREVGSVELIGEIIARQSHLHCAVRVRRIGRLDLCQPVAPHERRHIACVRQRIERRPVDAKVSSE